MQANLRNEHLDTFLRAVWFSYSAVIMLGANAVFILRGDTRSSLFGCALWKYRTYGRFLALAYTVAMSVAIVYLGEHYFVDSIAGVLLALGSWVSAKRVLRIFQACP
jgi:membrane-associated phospholipid phosphatase